MSDDKPYSYHESEMTQEFEALSEQGAVYDTDPLADWSRKQQRYKDRELIENDQGYTYLVVRKLIRKRFRIDRGKQSHYRQLGRK